MPRPTNRLASTTSPFLLRHAQQPVDWYPWGPAALDRAAALDRPILLSIGDTASLPCGTLEWGSVEDRHIADQMNRLFVNVKVDRTERPDLDELYRKAVQVAQDNRSLTIFLTPRGLPFGSGTWLPPEQGQGLSSFARVLAHADHIWQECRSEVERVAHAARELLASGTQLPSPAPLTAGWTSRVGQAEVALADDIRRGLRGVSEHPPAEVLEALLMDWFLRGDDRVAGLVSRTLDHRTTDGGLGFPSVRENTGLPTFQRPLAEHARLTAVYAHAAAAFDNPNWARMAVEACDFVRNRLTLESGGVLDEPDGNVVASHAAQMVRTWAIAGRTTDAPRFLEAAVRTARFLEQDLVVDGRLRRSWRNGQAGPPAFADDHAAVVLAFTDLYEATGDLHWIDRALHWADTLVSLFWNPTGGGLFYTGNDAEPLIARSMNPIPRRGPSANGLAAFAFARLDTLTGRTDLGARADDILSRYQAISERHPRAFGLEAVAAAWRTETVEKLAILGAPDAAATREMLRAADAQARPLMVVAQVGPDQQEGATRRIPWLAHRAPAPTGAKAYFCQGTSCQLPVRTASALQAQLSAARPHRPNRSLLQSRDKA